MSGQSGENKKRKGPNKAIENFESNEGSARRELSSSHDISNLRKKKKTEHSQKTPKNYIKKIGMERHMIDQEMLLLNLLQLFHPIQTKARMLSDNTKESLLIEKLPDGYEPLFNYLRPYDATENKRSDNKENIDTFKSVIKGGKSGMGELLPLMFLFNEVDAKTGNFFYDKNTQKIARIDMDMGFGDKVSSDLEFQIAPADLTNILTPTTYKADNWLHYKNQGKPTQDASLPLKDEKLYSPEFRR